MQNTIRLAITVTYSVEKEIAVDVPLSAVESASIDRGNISDIDQLDEEFLRQLYKKNGIDPANVEDQVWEIIE